jgi:hypothetical protein
MQLEQLDRRDLHLTHRGQNSARIPSAHDEKRPDLTAGAFVTKRIAGLAVILELRRGLELLLGLIENDALRIGVRRSRRVAGGRFADEF